MNMNATQKQKDDHCYTYNSKSIFLHIVLPRFGQTKKGTVVHCCVRSLHSCIQARNVEQSLPKEEELNVQRHEPGLKKKTGMEHPNFSSPDSSVLEVQESHKR